MMPREAFMQDYEIRILGDRHNHTIIEVMHLNDSGAIRTARSLAAGRRFEVWRGVERIDFEERGKPTPAAS